MTVVAGVSCHVAFHERDSHLSQFEAFMLGEVAEALMSRVANGSSRARQQAATQLSFTGRGRPRLKAYAKTLDGQGEAARRRVLEALGYRQIAAADPLGGEQAGDEQRGVLGSTPE